VTGTEVLTGRVSDRNGPWLAERLRELGVDLAHTTIVGDRPEDMLAALRFMAAQGSTGDHQRRSRPDRR
jgi:nicotinamide-nucleotide amidase